MRCGLRTAGERMGRMPCRNIVILLYSINALDVPDPQRDGRGGGEGAARRHAGALPALWRDIEQAGSRLCRATP